MRTGSTHETDAKKSGRQAQDTARDRQQGPRKIAQGLHQEGARDGRGEQLLVGHKLRNKRETGAWPHKGKNTGESRELVETRGLREEH